MVHMSEPTTQHVEQVPEWTLGWKLKRALDFAGVTAQEMAAELGVHVGTVSRYMNDREEPRRAYLIAWALRCGIPLSWFLADEPARPVADDYGPPSDVTDADIPSGMPVDHSPSRAEILAHRKAFKLKYATDAQQAVAS